LFRTIRGEAFVLQTCLPAAYLLKLLKTQTEDEKLKLRRRRLESAVMVLLSTTLSSSFAMSLV
jgi:hypothetical protein